jgi:hypothetical protein
LPFSSNFTSIGSPEVEHPSKAQNPGLDDAINCAIAAGDKAMATPDAKAVDRSKFFMEHPSPKSLPTLEFDRAAGLNLGQAHFLLG